MDSVEKASQLHDKVTRGFTLTAKERKQLEAWYAKQDTLENEILFLPAGRMTSSDLEAQMDAALAQAISVTQQIRKISSENAKLRREIAVLRRQLTQRIGTQPA
ncbi:MAG: hypothetical protein DYG87_06625 [Anaerolineae bacterium CFX3]|jgi:hypothetical protein|nr:hypothetical protein [Anaerolineae bacterium CFX3]MCQ3946738.1 hypothetical protein [Anaerolineae bacterium]MCZ7547792.1 hypothetical protein [Anaerolineales bacterium]OQY82240.1 MAG: hypothetical protein B6D40_09440 [Anaerolineae bacterium UTCFX3]GER78967.1 conserved hypothetical protein [Candidatus Denitrolinea symbiosum]